MSVMSATARACAAVFSLLAAGAAPAQPVASATGASEAPSGNAVSYQSPLADYQRFTEEKLGAWREANDNVGRIGGWREYAKEARQPANSGAQAPTDAAPAAPRDPRAGDQKR